MATAALGVMGLFAAMLAVTGVFGMAAYSVSKRLKEFGIRVALGSRRTQLMRAALVRPLVLLFSGSILGLLLGVVGQRSARAPHLPGHVARPSGPGRGGRDHDARRYGCHLDSRTPRFGGGPRAIAS